MAGEKESDQNNVIRFGNERSRSNKHVHVCCCMSYETTSYWISVILETPHEGIECCQ